MGTQMVTYKKENCEEGPFEREGEGRHGELRRLELGTSVLGRGKRSNFHSKGGGSLRSSGGRKTERASQQEMNIVG